MLTLFHCVGFNRASVSEGDLSSQYKWRDRSQYKGRDPVCCDRSRGTQPDSRIREGAYDSMGGSILPRTRMLKQMTNATAHSKALQMHKAPPKLAESAAAEATNAVALPDPAAPGKP